MLNYNSHHNHIVFVRNISYGNSLCVQPRSLGVKAERSTNININKIGSKTICLLNKLQDINLFQKMPKTFIITTNTGSCNFNIEMILDTSSVISDFIKDNPQQFQYHIDVDDTENVLSKIKEMYEGQTVIFDEDQLPIAHKIAKILNFECFPNFLKPESLKTSNNDICNRKMNPYLAAEIQMSDFSHYLQIESPCSFIIKTHKNEYKCKMFGILSSLVLSEIISKDPTSSQYFYDFDDEFDEFKDICDFFNFKNVSITMNNMNSIKEIAEDLQISCLLNDVDKYINDKENFSKTIDQQQAIVDSVDDLFDMLYNIEKITVQSVAKTIINSKWSQTEDKVHELAAFIIQVIKADFLLHQFILDLLLQIDKESNESNKLKKLLPFIISILTYNAFEFLPKLTINQGFGKASSYINQSQRLTHERNMAIYGFIYNLYKNGLISKEDMNEYLDNYSLNVPEINVWFFSELIEIYSLEKLQKSIQAYPLYNEFINSYLPDKIELYKEMRDKGEPTDLLTKALRDDDVDTLQSIVSKSRIDFENTFVPFNIFENYIKNGNTRYINYAAAYGSIKCFKFLLLNHDTFDEYSFSYAVFGGNTEIIQIIYQNNQENDEVSILAKPNNRFKPQLDINYNSDKLVPAIMKHRNDIFDWIFEQVLFNNNIKNNPNFSLYLKFSVENGNAHSLIEIIEKCFTFENSKGVILNNCSLAAENGFYMIVQLLFNFLSDKSHNNFINFDPGSTVYFDNLSIFKFFMEKMNQGQLMNALNFAIKRDYLRIVKYFFDEIINNTNFDVEISENVSFNLLEESITNKTNKMFNYLLEQIKILCPSLLNDVYQIDQLLDHLCKSTKNVEIAKTLTELITEKNNNWYFTSHFKDAAAKPSVEICKYFIDKKVFIEYEKLTSYIDEISSINEEIFILIIQNVSPETKELFFGCLDKAIQNKNKKLVEYLLKEGALTQNALKLAVNMNDLDLVELILKYNSEPSFINSRFRDGTALSIAVTNNNLLIVKRLLSIPGIDPNLFGANNNSPLIEAVEKRNLDIFDAILDFYGENICQQRWMINKIIQMFVDGNEKLDKNKKQLFHNPAYVETNNVTHLISPEKEEKVINHIINSLLNLKCVDINYHFKHDTLLTYACNKNNFTLVSIILEYENIDVNLPESRNGDTPLIISIKQNYYEIAKLLIDHLKIDVNIHNFDHQTALTIAAKNGKKNFIDLIINNEGFNPKESLLNYAFLISKGETLKNLLSIKSLDVNYIDYTSFKTPLIDAVLSNDIEKVDLIINHPSFDKNKSQLKTALKETIVNDRKDIFIKLFKGFENDLNTFQIDNRNLLDFAAINSNQDIIAEILKNPKFDSKKSDILKAFVDSYSVTLSISKTMQNQNANINNPNNMMFNPNNMMFNQNNMMFNQNNMMFNPNNMMFNQNNVMNNQDNLINTNLTDNQKQSPINVMNELYEYDKEHDHLIDFNTLLPNGKSFFTSMESNNEYNGEITRFLLDHGADPNKPDSKGILPLEAAFNHSSNDCAFELINSNRINLTQKIKITYFKECDPSNPKYTTYLHLAARFANSEILENILYKNAIDINATNDYGDTPLIEACRMKKKNNIIALFESDFCNDVQKIDFLHKNNNGEDAIHAVDPSANAISTTDKDEFLGKLMDSLNKFGKEKYDITDNEDDY